MIEDKLRIHFKRWLELADVKQQSAQTFRKYIIIVIDGIDKLREPSGKEELPEWLPSDIPENIRVLVTCNRNSRSFNYLTNKITSKVQINPFDLEKKIEVFEWYSRGLDEQKYDLEKLKNFVISSESCENALYLKLLLHFCLLNIRNTPYMSYKHFEGVLTPEELFEEVIEFYSANGFHKNIIIKVLGYLAISNCGLTLEELSQICSHSESVINVIEVFSICVYSYESLWMFRNDFFSKVILNKSYPNPLKLHLDTIESLDNCRTTVRTVHEKLFHYKESKEWMALKDSLCILDVFFIMYTPQYRFELFKFWILLQEHHFDPVQEYNKSLEHFVEQHNPKNQEIFIILVQFCRFFKEFSELEAEDICEFRHPPLKRLHELKELNIFDEISSLEGVVNQTLVNPLRKDESFAVENKKSRSQLKESILVESPFEENNAKRLRNFAVPPQAKQKETYFYKRWLWIQFPWCSLDVYSDFSQIMSVFSAPDLNFQHDNEMAMTSLKIIREARLKATKRYVQPRKSVINQMNSSDSNERSLTAYVKASGILNDTLPPIILAAQLNPIEKKITRFMTRGSTTENLKNKCTKTDYNFDLMFKELTPSNVLLKVGAKVADYSNHEILKKKKENNELQTNYNRLVNEGRIKNLQLESIKSQIAKSEDKMKEGKEISLRIEGMKKKMEKIYEKINKAEVESKRLEQVITCCFKNSAKNELWENGLEKGIENIKDLIEIEKLELSQYENEEETLNLQISEFEKWFQDKIKIQENTLDRVVEQFSFKSSIKEALVNGENKRAMLVNTKAPPRSENYFNNKLKERQSTLKKVSKLKEVLEGKIQNFEKTIQKLQTVTSITGPHDITSIIWQLERNEELYQARSKLDDKLKDLKSQKDALDVKLSFLKKKDPIKTFNYELNPEVATQTISELEKKIVYYSEVCQKQEVSYYSCEGIITQLTNLLGIQEKATNCKGLNVLLKKIGDRVLGIKSMSANPFIRSQTLKVSTLQVPYSSKYNPEEIASPFGPSALLNNSAAGSPSISPNSSMGRGRRKTSNLKKNVLKLPR